MSGAKRVSEIRPYKPFAYYKDKVVEGGYWWVKEWDGRWEVELIIRIDKVRWLQLFPYAGPAISTEGGTWGHYIFSAGSQIALCPATKDQFEVLKALYKNDHQTL